MVGHARHDFSKFWENETFNDVTITISERDEGRDPFLPPPAKKTMTRAEVSVFYELPASRALLSSSSEYFLTRFSSKLEEGAAHFPLVVGPGEAEPTYEVIKAIYKGLPEGLTAAKLVEMSKAADRLQSPIALDCVNALAKLPIKDWNWDAVIEVCLLPHIRPLAYHTG